MEELLDDYLDDLVYERVQDIIVASRQDSGYKPLWEELKRQSAIVRECPGKWEETSANYLAALHACHDYENTVVYLSGFHDCISMFKALGLI